jgi:hypothetical protein
MMHDIFTFSTVKHSFCVTSFDEGAQKSGEFIFAKKTEAAKK